jgi:hypothetical protein
VVPEVLERFWVLETVMRVPVIRGCEVLLLKVKITS